MLPPSHTIAVSKNDRPKVHAFWQQGIVQAFQAQEWQIPWCAYSILLHIAWSGLFRLLSSSNCSTMPLWYSSVMFCELAAGQWLKNEVSQGGRPKNNCLRSSPEQRSCANSVWRTHTLSAFRGEQSLQLRLKALQGKQTELKTTNAKALKQKKC